METGFSCIKRNHLSFRLLQKRFPKNGESPFSISLAIKSLSPTAKMSGNTRKAAGKAKLQIKHFGRVLTGKTAQRHTAFLHSDLFEGFA